MNNEINNNINLDNNFNFENQVINESEKLNINESINEEENQSFNDENQTEVIPKKLPKKFLWLIIGGITALVGIVIALILILSKPEYTVTFDSIGGSKIPNQEIKEGNVVVKPVDPIKEDYQFINWTLNGKEYNFDEKVYSNFTLEANWEIKLMDEIFEITFNTSSDTVIEKQNINGNGKVIKPEDPTKAHFTFLEWQLNGETYDFENTLVKKDMELVAVRKEDEKYTVTFNSDLGSKVDNQIIYINETAQKPTNPVRNGYKFIEWQLDGTTYDFSNKITKDIELKAKWEQLKTFTVTFNTDGGSMVASKTVVEGNKVSKPTNPTKEGYTFGGWLLNGKQYNFNNLVNENITLKASWNVKPVVYHNVLVITSLTGSTLANFKIEHGKILTKEELFKKIQSPDPSDPITLEELDRLHYCVGYDKEFGCCESSIVKYNNEPITKDTIFDLHTGYGDLIS